MLNKKKFSPFVILGGFVLLIFVLTPILMYTSNIGATGGEQKPITTFATMATLLVLGSAIISILIPFFFWKWFKKNWWFSVFIVLTIVPASAFIWENLFENPYGFVETNDDNNGVSLSTKTEYYNMEKEQIRSVSFWKNNKKDSIWTIYTKDGKILEQTIYRDDTILSK